MATRKRTLSLASCSKQHAQVYYTGDTCPACRCRSAGLAIYKEYLTVTEMCTALLAKIRRK